MTPEIFAKWFRRQGHRVVRTESSYWVEVGSRSFQAFPYHWLISPSQRELDQLLRDHSAICLRYSTTWQSSVGAASYHVAFTGREYAINVLPKKTRPDIRHALQRGSVERVSFQRLAEEGWKLHLDTLRRQGREGAESEAYWKGLCSSAVDLPGFEAWAAIVDGQLAASLIVFNYEDCCNALYQQSRTDYLPLGVNNALTFVFTTEMLKRPGHPWIFYGLHSLDAPESVDKFKFHMRYTAKPVRQRVVFHPLFRPFVNKASHAVLRLGRKVLPGSSTLPKAEGMFRFYLQGLMPLSRQPLPPHLKFENPP